MGEYADSLKKTNKRTNASEAVTAAREAAAKDAAKAAKARADEAARAKAREAAEKAAALKAAQKTPVRDAHDKPKTTTTPPPPPPVVVEETKIKSSGTGTGTTVTTVTTGTGEDYTGGSSNPVMEPTPAPAVTTTTPPVSVKTPTRNVTDISSLVPQYDANYITKILFENLSAVELSIVERHDTIEGINQRYSIISNLSEIRKKYEVVKQLSIMDKFKPLTSIYTINIQDKIPQEDYLSLEDLNTTYQYLDENNQIVTREKGYWYIDTNGDLVVELINLEKNQQVEVLIDTNGTIYKVESWLQQMAEIS